MGQGIGVMGIYVHDQEEARVFYTEALGFQVHTDVQNGAFRWLTLQHPDQPTAQLGLFTPGPPVHDAQTAADLRALVAKGAMPPLVLYVDDCRAAYQRLRDLGADLTQPPIERFGTIDAGFRDPSGNAWKIIEGRG